MNAEVVSCPVARILAPIITRFLGWRVVRALFVRPVGLTLLTPPDDPWQRQCTFGGTACFDGVNVAITGGGTAHATCRLEAMFDAQLGRVRLALEGVEQATYVIEASSDLVRWEDVLIVPNVAGRMEFYDPTAPSSGHRFYRARTTP